MRGTLDHDETTQLPSPLSIRDIVASCSDKSAWEEAIAYSDDFIALEFDAQ